MMKPPPKIVSQIAGRTQKAAQDTVAGCRQFAAADLARAVLMDTANGRRCLESSASSWTSRAGLIQRMGDSFEARQAIAKAEWNDEEAISTGRNDPGVSASS